jgi:hypothetical protein
MASLTFAQAKSLVAPYITSQGASDPVVDAAVNFVNERFITSGQWRGNRFIYNFTVSQDASGNSYFDTVPGIESVIKVVAVDTYQNGEIAEISSDWYPFNDGGLGYLPPSYVGDTQIIRLDNVPAYPLPSSHTVDTQRYRVVGCSPETRSMYCLVRRGYVPLVNDADTLVPSNRNAYRYGAQAFNYENVNELERARVYWALAYDCLNEETQSFEDGTQGNVDVQTKAFSPSLIRNLI